MSGAGRKHRAKHLTEQYLDINGWNGPTDNQRLAVCLEAPHGQQVRVLQLGDTEETNAQVFVLVPRKFHKVIWLRVKDVVVVQDGGLEFKPSPEQMDMFLQEHADWRVRVEKAKESAEGMARIIERQPLFQQSTETTTSVLPTHSDSAHAVVAHDPLAVFRNPNRQNIRHRQQFFFGVEDEEDDEEEDEEEEEEREEEKGETEKEMNHETGDKA